MSPPRGKGWSAAQRRSFKSSVLRRQEAKRDGAREPKPAGGVWKSVKARVKLTLPRNLMVADAVADSAAGDVLLNRMLEIPSIRGKTIEVVTAALAHLGWKLTIVRVKSWGE